MDMPEGIKAIIDALRGGEEAKEHEKFPGQKPLEQRRRGYQLYVQEAQVNGEDPLSYEEWIKSQE